MFLLDTNIISEMRKIKTGRANANVTRWAEHLNIQETYLNSVIIGEIYRGILLKRHNKDYEQAQILQEWLDDLLVVYQGRILDVDVQIANIFAELNTPNFKSANDAYIASTAIAYDLTLATRNIKDFDGMPVKIINPFKFT
ncbi:type II toxin-antitoxin system VapC family toxin [Moraxella sp. K127]|uniref:type II toxin-antitoxin system VapC family toxin n=1 Tax=Moraxella TaxID=475 RepID=UPI001882F47A|nr:type II toxin-antitoxin system VapC family toxin [Moraxella sp. K127]MBE9590703.1 type II toxin-antitoxin system VapC family toxin [Moraxella sp. K127]